MASAIEYLDKAIDGFDRDPADTDFQRGYLEALRAVRAESGIAQALDAASELNKAVRAFVGNHGERAISLRISNASKRLSFTLGERLSA